MKKGLLLWGLAALSALVVQANVVNITSLRNNKEVYYVL